MAPEKIHPYVLKLVVNGHQITKVLIGQHYRIKHGTYMNDQLILELVSALDGGQFPRDSVSHGIEYYAADVIHGREKGVKRIYRLIWLFEGDQLEILGVINAYRRKKKVKDFK